MEAKALTVKQNNSIDLARFIFALLVVAIHVSPFGSTELLTVLGWLDFLLRDCIARVTVPFFFIASGYFLFLKTEINNFDILPCKTYLKKMIKLYLIWSAIYFPLGFGNAFFDEKGFLHGVIEYIKKFLFSTSFSHLWYLNALIFATAVIAFLLYKRIKPTFILGAGIVFYIIGLFGQSWFGFLEPLRNTFIWDILKGVQNVITTTRDGLFDGLIFVGIGMFFAYSKIKLTRKQALIGVAFSAVLLCAEALTLQYYNLSRSHDTYLFLLPCSIFLFALIKDIKLPNSEKYKKMRVHSSLIYFIHPWILRIVAVITYIIFKKADILLINYLITIFITILLAELIVKLSAKPKGKLLKNLYS